VNRVLKILLLIPVLYIVVMPFYFRHTTNLAACSALSINITDSSDYRFVTGREIRERIHSGNAKYSGLPVKDVSLGEIEERVAAISELRKTEAFITLDGVLHVEVDQRDPVLRVSASSGIDYYIDEEGYIIRKRGLYPPRVHVAGGNISISDAAARGAHVTDEGVPDILSDLFDLTLFLRKSQLWSAMIDQIEVGNGGDIILIPRTGGHRVVLGTADDIEMKFQTLEAFYSQVMPEVGWNRYSVLNLKYTGQVVCKKR
jgi:cell division protein FtsQ